MIGSSKICAVVAADDAGPCGGSSSRASASTRTVELRLDWLADDREIARFLRLAGRERAPRATLIATCRRRGGGGISGTIAKQFVHLAEALRAGMRVV